MNEWVPSHVCSTDFVSGLSASLPEVGCRRRRGMTDYISFRHYRISCRRYLLLRNKHLRVRQELKRERKRKHKVRLETLKLNRALMPLGKVGHLSASSRATGGAGLVCECCFATIKINKYGETVGDETCKQCHRLLCSTCCFAAEEAPMWYCRACVVRVKLMPLWRPATEGTVLPPLRPTKVSFGPTRVSFGE